jgi:dihydroorotate dehydrogenase (NAD+) catalytic subunit
MRARVGRIDLTSPLIAASGTVGSVTEWAAVADVSMYGAAVAKSVSPVPWLGRASPRLAPAGLGMLNGIGIQNSGIVAWTESMAQVLSNPPVPIWGSAVGHTPVEYAAVASAMADAGVPVIEANLSCPNLDDGEMFSFDARRSAEVVVECVAAAPVPVGAKLSPNTPDLLRVAEACIESGAEFLTLTNTALGFGIDLRSRRSLLSGGVGGYSGPGLKPIAMRCVFEVSRAFPGMPIIGCGGVTTGRDVLEFIVAGASAVAVGTLHFAEPKAGRRLMRELEDEMRRMGTAELMELVGSAGSW